MSSELRTDQAFHNQQGVANGSSSLVNVNGNSGEKFGYQGSGGPINRAVTAGGHPADNSQPAFPVYHRKFANPAPLGLLA